MTNRKQNNSLYIHLLSVINEALPLEYAIRAVRLANPCEMEQLSEINQKIRQYWITLGVNEKLIAPESLMDFAWDVIQIGFALTRRHGRIYFNDEFVDLIKCGLVNIQKMFGPEVRQLNIPATRHFRICDLLKGNDVLSLLNAVAQCLRDSRNHELSDEIELKKFVLGIREPIHLHPGIQYVASERHEGKQTRGSFGIILDTAMEFSMPDLKRQIYEFLYQYAVRRESQHLRHDIAHGIINEFLKDELFGRIVNHKVKRIDGFISLLTGLYCWDLVQQYRQEGRKSAVEDAVNDTLKIYPKNVRKVEYEAIRKNYNTARVAIRKVSFGETAT